MIILMAFISFVLKFVVAFLHLSLDEILFVPLQMLQIFNKLPGFKEIRLLGIQ